VLPIALLLAACNTMPGKSDTPIDTSKRPLKIGLALGGGGTRGFAHVGVIKALEAQGITPDIIVGTSVGSLVGALYSSGLSGFKLQEATMLLEKNSVVDWGFPDRGFLSGESLEQFVNNAVKNRPLEKLQRTFAVVATDLKTGNEIIFRTGNTGQAVRASCAVPGIFKPVMINGRSYVDGGLVKPVPISEARSLGADFVIAVDISNVPENNQADSTTQVLLQTFDIMSQAINRYELPKADVVIRPTTREIDQMSLSDKSAAILEGEKAAAAMMPQIKSKLEALRAARLLESGAH
jgi:NTE family protein